MNQLWSDGLTALPEQFVTFMYKSLKDRFGQLSGLPSADSKNNGIKAAVQNKMLLLLLVHCVSILLESARRFTRCLVLSFTGCKIIYIFTSNEVFHSSIRLPPS